MCIARCVRATVLVAAVAMTGLTLALGWLTMVSVALATMLTAVLVLFLPSTRRFIERQRLGLLDKEAEEIHATLVARMLPEHAAELARLSSMVENVRRHELRRHEAVDGSTVAASSGVADQLDVALLSYVDRVIELYAVEAGFATTLDDEPRAPRPPRPDESASCSAEQEQVPAPADRLFHLRLQAREACHRRIQSLERDRETIAQLVYLIHEQTLATGSLPLQPADLISELLDEAELARDVREATGAALQTA